MAEYTKPLPLITDPDHAPHWEGAKKHELWVRRCKQCGKYQWPPRPMCAQCQSFDLEWVKAKGEGILYSYTIGYRAMHPGFQPDVPYGIVVVEMEEGPRMMGNSTNMNPEDLKIGMPMSVVFNDVTDKVTLVNWEPA